MYIIDQHIDHTPHTHTHIQYCTYVHINPLELEGTPDLTTSQARTWVLSSVTNTSFPDQEHLEDELHHRQQKN